MEGTKSVLKNFLCAGQDRVYPGAFADPVDVPVELNCWERDAPATAWCRDAPATTLQQRPGARMHQPQRSSNDLVQGCTSHNAPATAWCKDAPATTHNAQRSTLNAQRSTLNSQLSTLNSQLSTLNSQLLFGRLCRLLSGCFFGGAGWEIEADLAVFGIEGEVGVEFALGAV